jgi:hypothetical protein
MWPQPGLHVSQHAKRHKEPDNGLLRHHVASGGAVHDYGNDLSTLSGLVPGSAMHAMPDMLTELDVTRIGA